MKKKLCIISYIALLTSCDSILSPIFENTKTIVFDNLIVTNKNDTAYILYIDENYTIQTILLSTEKQNTIEIPLKNNHLTPILLFSSAIDAQPKGCIYPLSRSISVHGGFSAWILYRLLAGTKNDSHLAHEYLSHFNWMRFTSYIQKYDNPWILNQDLILENIADRTFNVYSIKVL